MRLKELNQSDKSVARDMLSTACGSQHWTSMMVKGMPFASMEELMANASETWYQHCSEKDWLEAFTHHPKIGDISSLQKKFAATAHLAGSEQASVNQASEKTIELLAKANEIYEAKFGFIFIVCATGKPAEHMLRILQERLHNSYKDELAIAMGEQFKITTLRLKKIFEEEDWSWLPASHITTHVLDTSIGKPGKEISIRLQSLVEENEWLTIAHGITNSDGRIPDLLPQGKKLSQGVYKMIFDSGRYFQQREMESFYPLVEIRFHIKDEPHYHIPLLLNPFGYSTYRGS